MLILPVFISGKTTKRPRPIALTMNLKCWGCSTRWSGYSGESAWQDLKSGVVLAWGAIDSAWQEVAQGNYCRRVCIGKKFITWQGIKKGAQEPLSQQLCAAVSAAGNTNIFDPVGQNSGIEQFTAAGAFPGIKRSDKVVILLSEHSPSTLWTLHNNPPDSDTRIDSECKL